MTWVMEEKKASSRRRGKVFADLPRLKITEFDRGKTGEGV